MYNNTVKAPEFYKAGIYIRLSEADQGKFYEAERIAQVDGTAFNGCATGKGR